MRKGSRVFYLTPTGIAAGIVLSVHDNYLTVRAETIVAEGKVIRHLSPAHVVLHVDNAHPNELSADLAKEKRP